MGVVDSRGGQLVPEVILGFVVPKRGSVGEQSCIVRQEMGVSRIMGPVLICLDLEIRRIRRARMGLH